MPGLACNACNVEFPDEGVQKSHYRSEWHRYNLKRKVCCRSPCQSFLLLRFPDFRVSSNFVASGILSV